MDTANPNIRAVRPDKGRSVIVTWKGGAESIVDLADHIGQFAALAPLRSDEALFRAIKVGEWGWCAHWFDEIEISSDTLLRLAPRRLTRVLSWGKPPNAHAVAPGLPRRPRFV